jgi:Bacterial regulatory helix-turn-helix protein, lysR family
MRKTVDWESQIGRRLKLRDLRVFMTIVQRGSMARAAEHLGVSQPFRRRVSAVGGELQSPAISAQGAAVDLPSRPWPVEIITLEHRTPSPVVQRFIAELRAYVGTIEPALVQPSV